MGDPFVVIEHVHKAFGEITAVDDISFTLDHGDLFGLLGPNGAGKTTLIRMLSTVIPPDAGDITIGGASVRSRPDEARKFIGVCPQELALYDDLTGRENTVFFARMSGLSRAEASESTGEFLELVGLTERADHRVKTYSGGMKRRLNIAMALVSRPQLLFLDEPTVGVDPQSRNHIFETVERLNEEGMTVIYTTHYMEEADRLCRRLLILDHGRVIREGSPGELKAALGDSEHATLEGVFLSLTGRSLRG